MCQDRGRTLRRAVDQGQDLVQVALVPAIQGIELQGVIARFQSHDRAQCIHQPGLAQPRQADQQRMAATKHRSEHKIDHLLLTDETPVDRGLGLPKCRAQRFDLRHKRLRVGHANAPFRFFCAVTKAKYPVSYKWQKASWHK